MKLSDLANPECEECGGEGYTDYGGFRSRSDGVKTLPCKKCFKDLDFDDFEEEGEF